MSGDFIAVDKNGRHLQTTPKHHLPPTRNMAWPFKSETSCLLLEIHYFDRMKSALDTCGGGSYAE